MSFPIVPSLHLRKLLAHLLYFYPLLHLFAHVSHAGEAKHAAFHMHFFINGAVIAAF